MSFEVFSIPAVVGAVAPLARLVLDWIRQRAKERTLAKSSLENVLNEADLETLGHYLDNQLGEIDVARYAQQGEARDRVDRVLARLEEFLGPEEPASAETSEDTRRRITFQTTDLGGLPQDVDERLDLGDDWGALVRLRIALEHAARAALLDRNLEVTPRTSFARMLDMLRRQENLAPQVIDAAMVARSIANRAAHGQAVSPDEVASALRAGAFALRAFRNSSKKPS